LTAQGHSGSIFKRAIENGNLVVAESAAREVGRLSLEEAPQSPSGWSVYRAERSQPVPTGGKWERRVNGSNKPNPSPPVAISADRSAW
jgi:hypothetical protein